MMRGVGSPAARWMITGLATAAAREIIAAVWWTKCARSSQTTVSSAPGVGGRRCVRSEYQARCRKRAGIRNVDRGIQRRTVIDTEHPPTLIRPRGAGIDTVGVRAGPGDTPMRRGPGGQAVVRRGGALTRKAPRSCARSIPMTPTIPGPRWILASPTGSDAASAHSAKRTGVFGCRGSKNDIDPAAVAVVGLDTHRTLSSSCPLVCAVTEDPGRLVIRAPAAQNARGPSVFSAGATKKTRLMGFSGYDGRWRDVQVFLSRKTGCCKVRTASSDLDTPSP